MTIDVPHLLATGWKPISTGWPVPRGWWMLPGDEREPYTLKEALAKAREIAKWKRGT